MVIAVVSTFLSLFCAVCAAYAIERLRFSGARFVGMAIFLAYLVPPSILFIPLATMVRSEEHTSELRSLMRISYAVFCLKKKTLQSLVLIPYTTTIRDFKHYTL